MWRKRSLSSRGRICRGLAPQIFDIWKAYAKQPMGKVVVGYASKRGFETVFDVTEPSHSSCVQVVAQCVGRGTRLFNMACL
jgi:hypothetical protein